MTFLFLEHTFQSFPGLPGTLLDLAQIVDSLSDVFNDVLFLANCELSSTPTLLEGTVVAQELPSLRTNELDLLVLVPRADKLHRLFPVQLCLFEELNGLILLEDVDFVHCFAGGAV